MAFVCCVFGMRSELWSTIFDTLLNLDGDMSEAQLQTVLLPLQAQLENYLQAEQRKLKLALCALSGDLLGFAL
jgi:hypothetical protein